MGISLSSLPLIFGALPLFLLLYYLSKPAYRVYELLAFSVWFAYVNEVYFIHLIYLLVLIGINYGIGLLSSFCREKQPAASKACIAAGVILDAGVLAYYKYYSFVVNLINNHSGLSLPVKDVVALAGCSFFTFTMISYLADVNKGKCTAEKNPVKFYAYILMFPKFLMGPITRYVDVKGDMDGHAIPFSDVGHGAKRFMIGFCKKTIIADNLALLVQEVNTNADIASSTIATLWISSVAYSLELFFDFAGYSDMAIGLSRMLGIHLKENFNYPYICRSFTDFWRRWHISLSEWFRDYVYIPLGGSRRSLGRNIFNLFVVWFLTGMWHGTGFAFIAWGMSYFVMLLIERYLVKPKRLNKPMAVLWQIFTLMVVNFNWVLFSHSSGLQGLKYLAGMSGLYWNNPIANMSDIRYFREYGLYLILGIIFSTPAAKLIEEKLESSVRFRNAASIAVPVVYLLAFLWGISFVMLGFHNPFLYQQF